MNPILSIYSMLFRYSLADPKVLSCLWFPGYALGTLFNFQPKAY